MKSVLYVHAQIVNFLPDFLLLIAIFKILTNSKHHFESRIKFLFRLSFTLIGRFSPVKHSLPSYGTRGGVRLEARYDTAL
jgi:hypothetical protein